MLGKSDDENLDSSEENHLRSLAFDYWNRLTDLVEPWSDIRDGDLKPQEARQEYISSYALALWALGSVGKVAFEEGNGHWLDNLDGLRDINWDKKNPDWQGICMTGNEVVTRMPTHRATASYILWKIGLDTERPPTVLPDVQLKVGA